MKVNLVNFTMPRVNRSVGVVSRPIAFGNGQAATYIPFPDLGSLDEETRLSIATQERLEAGLDKLPADIRAQRLDFAWSVFTPDISPMDIAVGRKLNELAGDEIGAYGAKKADFEEMIRGFDVVRQFEVRSQRGLNLLSTVLQDIYVNKLSLQEVLGNLAKNAKRFLG